MIGSITGLVLLVVAGLGVSAWSIRLRRVRNARSDAARDAVGPNDSGANDGDDSGWLGHFFSHSPASQDASPATAHAGSDGGSSEAGAGNSSGGHGD
jgi:hypothetical protein